MTDIDTATRARRHRHRLRRTDRRRRMSEFSAEYMTHIEAAPRRWTTRRCPTASSPCCARPTQLIQGFQVTQLGARPADGDDGRAGRRRPRHGRRLAVPRHGQGDLQRQPPGDRRRDDPAVGVRRGLLGRQGAPGLRGHALLRPHGPRPDDAAQARRPPVLRAGRALRRRVGPARVRPRLPDAARSSTSSRWCARSSAGRRGAAER